VAAVLGWVVLREPLTLSRLLGVACVVLGVILLRK
jgi:drug/metabolite transporter (DMT)-like permease